MGRYGGDKKMRAEQVANEVKVPAVLEATGSQRPKKFRKTFDSGRSPRHDSTNGGIHRGKEKRKQKQMNKGKETLKNKEEYSHLLNSTKLTVFDWDTTLVLRNIPPQVEVVKKSLRKTLANISIKKFCVIKKTFKNKVHVLLACVLEKKADLDEAIVKLQNFIVNNLHIIVSPFIKPNGFQPGAFSVCIKNFSEDAADKDLATILSDCGVLSAIDVDYSETGSMTKVLVNVSDESSEMTLLEKNRTLVKSAVLKVVPVKRNTSVIIGNVHPKLSMKKLSSVFGEKILHVQKVLNMMVQIFLEDEEMMDDALRKDGESVDGSVISVRPWSKKNTKQYKAVVKVTGGPTSKKNDLLEFLYAEMQKCGTLCCITPVNKNVSFLVSFEIKDGLNAALELNGQIVHGRTLEITKKKQKEGGSEPPKSSNNDAIASKKHVFF